MESHKSFQSCIGGDHVHKSSNLTKSYSCPEIIACHRHFKRQRRSSVCYFCWPNTKRSPSVSFSNSFHFELCVCFFCCFCYSFIGDKSHHLLHICTTITSNHYYALTTLARTNRTTHTTRMRNINTQIPDTKYKMDG